MNAGEILEVAHAKYASATHALKNVNFNRAFALTAVNLGYHRVERAALWTFSEAEVENVQAVAGQRAATNLPADLGKALTLYNIRTESHLQYHDDRQAVLPLDVSGEPDRYSEWAGEVRFWPTPTRADSFLLRYYKTWADLTEGETPVLPAAFHELLASYAAYVLVLRTPPEGDRFLPASAAEPFKMEWREGMAALLESPYTLKSLDEVPWHAFQELAAGADGIHW